jgi:hypothetical protein
MSNGIFAPQGFVPMNYRDGTAYTGATQAIEIDPTSPAIGLNDPVVITTGKVAALNPTESYAFNEATPTSFFGIFQGCYYQTKGTGQGAIYPFVNSKSWPGTGVELAEGTKPLAYVIVDPNVVFNVVTGGPNIPNGITQIQNYQVAGFTMNGVNSFGISKAYLSSTGQRNATPPNNSTVYAPFQIVGLADLPNNAWGQPYNNVLVIMNGTLTKAGTVGK